MEIGVELDQENAGYALKDVENAERISGEVAGAPIVNVEASFIVPEDQRHKDRVFPRMEQIRALASREDEPSIDLNHEMFGTRPYRRPDFDKEWRILKKSWSLHRRGREKLSKRLLKEASEEFYKKEPLDHIEDWIFRFSRFLGHPRSEQLFEDVAMQLKDIFALDGFPMFLEYYQKEMRAVRAERYFQITRDFMSNFAEYGQVYIPVCRGFEIPEGNNASSIKFDKTRSFYGDAFETFASSVDILAYLNNLTMGRNFDQFERLTRKQYLELDKASRFRPFSLNEAFTALCTERDNQLRNASHHGGFQFDASSQRIRYRAGKGGTGEEQTIGYTTYLARCTQIFLQTMTLLSFEILLCKQTKNPSPV